MIDYTENLKSALEECGLPVFHERFITDKPVPCISFIDTQNDDYLLGDTLEYSAIGYIVKVWSTRISDFYTYGQLIDSKLKPLGFKRTAASSLFPPEQTIGQFYMRYEATGRKTIID